MAFRPRETMRAVLDHPPDRLMIPILLLTMCAGFLKDSDPSGFRTAMATANMPRLGAMIAAILVVVMLLLLGLFYLFAWIVYAAGRFLEGVADIRAVRSALAWGCVPLVWALPYRVMVLLLWPASARPEVEVGDGTIRFNPDRLVDGCGAALIFSVIELALFVWYLYVASNALAEANRFSGWKGLGTLLLAAVAPLIVMIAAAVTVSL